jgi:UDP-N-acetylglucosamine transferase subunit ALG13
MIFVTAGTEHPFDRLFRAVDNLARGGALPDDAFGQTGLGAYVPLYFASTPFVAHGEFLDRLRAASMIVSHVGMGTILQAAQWGVPAVVLPRRASLGEHVNDHQLDSAALVEKEGLCLVAWTEEELSTKVRLAATWRPEARRSDGRLVEALRRDLHAIERRLGRRDKEAGSRAPVLSLARPRIAGRDFGVQG